MRRLGLAIGCAFVGFLTCGLAAAGSHVDSPPGLSVFPGQIEGGTALFVGRADRSGALQVTSGPKDTNPQWSPDGRRIVFERSVAEDVTSVWVVNADGTEERELDSDPYAERPRWSPDGRWIAYQVQTSETIPDGTRASTTYELWLVRPDGSGRRLLIRNGEGELGNENPRFHVQSAAWAWSPDSRHLAFVWPRGKRNAERGGVNLVDATSGRRRYLGPGVDVAWSPNGRSLAVTTNDQEIIRNPECGSIWIVAVASAQRRRVARPPGDSCGRFPRWSPDGRTVVFVRSGARRAFIGASPDGSRLQTVGRLRPEAYDWPAACARLFEYVSPLATGWIVRDAEARLRFVAAPMPRGDWRCKMSSRQ